MGATQSYIPPETALTTVAVAGAIVYGYLQAKSTPPDTVNPDAAESTGGDTGSSSKKGKKKKRGDAPASSKSGGGGSAQSFSGSEVLKPSQPNVVAFPEVIPGEFTSGAVGKATTDVAEQKPKKSNKKNKKKKAKLTIAPTNDSVPGIISPSSENRSVDSSDDEEGGGGGRPNGQLQLPHQPGTTSTSVSQARSPPLTRPHKQSTTSIDTDGSWTRVETRRGKRRNAPTASSASIPTGEMSHPLMGDPTASDAGATTSVTTGNSSPVAERGMEVDDGEEQEEDEGEPFLASIARERPTENRKTLAEKLLPKPRKTGVDDMTETPDYPTVARVMRVQPRADEQPVSGYSWADYEDVDASGTGDNDADGEDDGWGVVRRSRPKRRPADSTSANPSTSTPTKSPEAMTKRQRQNANRREAEKAAKDEAEADRLARLAKHKSELERIRMNEQIAGRK